MNRRPVLAAIAVILAAPGPLARAADVRLSGATTVVDRLLVPLGAKAEKATGHRIVVVGNGTGKGIADLVAGRCDAALSSEPLEIALEAAKTAGAAVKAGTLKFDVVSTDEIVFIVHPSNPVTSLSWEQLKAIHTGKIRNWREVGGKDMPITVFSDTVTGGTRAMIRHEVLGGADYGANVIALAAVKKVADMVAAEPGAIGGLGKGFYDPSRNRLVETRKLERPLGLITLGAPAPAVAQVSAALKAEVRKVAR